MNLLLFLPLLLTLAYFHYYTTTFLAFNISLRSIFSNESTKFYNLYEIFNFHFLLLNIRLSKLKQKTKLNNSIFCFRGALLTVRRGAEKPWYYLYSNTTKIKFFNNKWYTLDLKHSYYIQPFKNILSNHVSTFKFSNYNAMYNPFLVNIFKEWLTWIEKDTTILH